MTTTHDVVVAGGGPAGLAVALAAHRAGLDVVVCEKRAGTVDKACGEGLMPGAVRTLRRLGVEPDGHRIEGIVYRQGDVVARAPFRAGTGLGVRRTDLHAAMRARVDAVGVPVHERAVTGVEQHDDHVTAGGLRARYLVAADGLHSPLRTALGLGVDQRRGVSRWGQRRHFALAPNSSYVEVTWSADSEAYVTPVGPDLVGVAVLSRTRGSFDEHLAAFPALLDRLQGADPASAVRGAGPLRQRAARRVAGRVLLAGDAAGYVDALTGEGLAVAFASAEVLVDCLVSNRPERYEREWARVSRRSRWLTHGLLFARQQRLTAPRVVPLAARAPALFARAVDQLAR